MRRRRHRTFRGGIHPPGGKELSSASTILVAPVPSEMVIPLQQNIGATNAAAVSPGDRVEVGQKIGGADAFVSAPVHSPVAGTVRGIVDARNFAGAVVKAVAIDVDPVQPVFEPRAMKPLEQLDARDIRKIARDAGLVGMGGAGFPTHVKLTPPAGTRVDTVIINACECEPFLTCDHRLMLERPYDLARGMRLLMRAVDARRGIVGIEANKVDAAEGVRAALGEADDVSVEVLAVKYPEGSEKQLIAALTGREVPPGKLPSEVGCLVQNVGTAVAMYEAASIGKPLYERVVTVTGPGIKSPSNFLVKVGTPISTLISEAGGFSHAPAKVVVGGPMTGWAQSDLGTVITKRTSGVLALTGDLVDLQEEHDCVRCGLCVEACPMHLMPNFIADAALKEQWDRAKAFGALDCFECGCCSYTCPAHIRHIDHVRIAKGRLAALQRG